MDGGRYAPDELSDREMDADFARTGAWGCSGGARLRGLSFSPRTRDEYAGSETVMALECLC